MNKNYKYGFNLEEDLKVLYGKDYEHINEERLELFKELDEETLEIRQLRNIIQNPVPIVKEEYDEWKDIKEKILKNYSVKNITIKTLNLIEDFVLKYHIKQ